MLEGIIVIGIIGIALATAGRSFYRTMTGKNGRCACSGNCPAYACGDFAEMDQKQDTKKRGTDNE